MVFPIHSSCNEDNPHEGEMIQGSNTIDSIDTVQRPSSAVPTLYDSEFSSLAESVGLSRKKIDKSKSTVDQSPRTMESPKPAGLSSEKHAYPDTSTFQHVNSLEVTAEGVTSTHTSSNNDGTFGYYETDGVTSRATSQDSCRGTISKVTINDIDIFPKAEDIYQPDGSHVEACCTHALENRISFLPKMKKWNEQGNGPRKVNADCPDSESSYKETHNVNRCVSPSPHNLYVSSHESRMAEQLQSNTLPTQFGKRTSVDIYHTQSRSHPNKGSWSGNSTQSQPSKKMRPFDICESYSSPSSLPNHNEVLVTKQVNDYTREILRPGMVLLKKYIPLDDQIEIVRSCRHLGLGEGGFYQPVFNISGAKLHLQMMCLGLDWDPNTKKYEEIRRVDGARAPAIPLNFVSLTEKAIEAAHDLINADLGEGRAVDILPHMHPNICIVNFYKTSGRLGLHQDKDESEESLRKGLPVVSISLGDSAQFLYGDQRDIHKADKVLLESGDVLIFGGSSRHIFHGVDSIIPDAAPDALQLATKLRPGRLNLTFREF